MWRTCEGHKLHMAGVSGKAEVRQGAARGHVPVPKLKKPQGEFSTLTHAPEAHIDTKVIYSQGQQGDLIQQDTLPTNKHRKVFESVTDATLKD